MKIDKKIGYLEILLKFCLVDASKSHWKDPLKPIFHQENGFAFGTQLSRTQRKPYSTGPRWGSCLTLQTRVGSARLHVGSARLLVWSARLFGYQHVGIGNANPSRAKTQCELFRAAVEYRLNVMKQATAVFGNDNGAMVVYFSAFVLNCHSVHLQYLADDGTAGVCLGMVHPILLWYI